MRVFVAALAALTLATVQAQGGWSASPVITLERTRFSVAAATPGCDEELLVERGVQLVANSVAAVASLGPGGDARADITARIATRLGDVSHRLGSPMVLQRHATCASACAPIPLDARSIGAVRVFYAAQAGEPFREVRLGAWGNYFRWDPEIDTTLVTADARWVCLQARSWVAGQDREAFFLVRYVR